MIPKCALFLSIIKKKNKRVEETLTKHTLTAEFQTTKSCVDPAWFAHNIQVHFSQWGSKDRGLPTARSGRDQKWEKPAENHIKVNCDAAFDSDTSNSGWGCVLRDSEGDVVTVSRGRVEVLMNPMHGELIACIHGVQADI